MKATGPEAARKERLGRKWVCFKCGTRFYDMNKPEPLCPRVECKADQRESPVLKATPASSKGKGKGKSKPKAKAKKAAPPPPPPKEAPKKPRFADSEEEMGVAVEEDTDEIAADLEEELAEDLGGNGFEVSDGEGEGAEEPDED